MPIRDSSVLIIGGDSMIGRQLCLSLAALGIKVLRTSRRQVIEQPDTYFFDLSGTIDESIGLPMASTVILCAGISGYASCSREPAMASQVNIVNTTKLASIFLKNKCHLIFISSAAVLGDSRSTEEGCLGAPLTVYGAYKYAAELAIEAEAKKYGAPLSIVRLTKVLSWETPFINKWLLDASKHLPVLAFSDLSLSPISIEYVCDAMLKVIANRSVGVFHLSGDRSIGYSELAESMINMALLPKVQIRDIACPNRDVREGFFDTTVLSMSKISRDIGIYPELLNNVLISLQKSMSKK